MEWKRENPETQIKWLVLQVLGSSPTTPSWSGLCRVGWIALGSRGLPIAAKVG